MTAVFSHPVLTPISDDYIGAFFMLHTGNAPKVIDDDIVITIGYELKCSILEDLISEKKAEFACQVTCNRTNFSELFNQKTESSQTDLLIIPKHELFESVEITPYILARTDFSLKIMMGHNEDYLALDIKAFDIDKGTILAIGSNKKVIGSYREVNSVIDIVNSDSVPIGEFNFTFDEERIKINVNAEDRIMIDRLRAGGEFSNFNALFPSLYFQAVNGAILALNSDNMTLEWEKVFEEKINEICDLEIEEVKQESVIYAQKLLGLPLCRMLEGFNKFRSYEEE